MANLFDQKIVFMSFTAYAVAFLSLKNGTATLMINMFDKKELYKPWILVPVLSKSVEKWGSCERLENSMWPTLNRHFKYLISF